MKPQLSRRPTFNERLYEIGQTLVPPFAIQYLLEGAGAIEAEALQSAVNQLAERIPALTLVLQRNTWVHSGQKPAVYVHEQPFDRDWNGETFRRPLNQNEGGSAAFHLFPGESTALLFRVQHSLMDAKAVQRVLRSLFAILRGEMIPPDSAFPADALVRKRLAPRQSRKQGGISISMAGRPTPPWLTPCLSHRSHPG